MGRGFILAGVLFVAATTANASEYRFCVSCDTHVAQSTVRSDIVDFGKEWYRVKTAMTFQKAYRAQGCSVSDFSEPICGHLFNEELVFVSVSGDQITGLLSGNPVLIGQTFVEIIIGLPITAVNWTIDKAGDVADWVSSWFD